MAPSPGTDFPLCFSSSFLAAYCLLFFSPFLLFFLFICPFITTHCLFFFHVLLMLFHVFTCSFACVCSPNALSCFLHVFYVRMSFQRRSKKRVQLKIHKMPPTVLTFMIVATNKNSLLRHKQSTLPPERAFTLHCKHARTTLY